MTLRAAKWLIAEDVRDEANGKLSILGVYLNDLIILNGPPAEPQKDKPIPLEAFALLAAIRTSPPELKVERSFKIEFRAEGDEHSYLAAEGKSLSDDEGVFSILLKIRPFPVVRWGRHRVTIKSEDWEDSFSFELRLNPVSGESPG